MRRLLRHSTPFWYNEEKTGGSHFHEISVKACGERTQSPPLTDPGSARDLQHQSLRCVIEEPGGLWDVSGGPNTFRAGQKRAQQEP